MICHFVVGQKVVCISEHCPDRKAEMDAFGISYPAKGRVYTIRALGAHEDMPVVFLEEIVNPVLHYVSGEVTEQGFGVKRFRPVVTRKTDISIFTDMLIEQKQPVDA